MDIMDRKGGVGSHLWCCALGHCYFRHHGDITWYHQENGIGDSHQLPTLPGGERGGGGGADRFDGWHDIATRPRNIDSMRLCNVAPFWQEHRAKVGNLSNIRRKWSGLGWFRVLDSYGCGPLISKNLAGHQKSSSFTRNKHGQSPFSDPWSPWCMDPSTTSDEDPRILPQMPEPGKDKNLGRKI